MLEEGEKHLVPKKQKKGRKASPLVTPGVDKKSLKRDPLLVVRGKNIKGKKLQQQDNNIQDMTMILISLMAAKKAAKKTKKEKQSTSESEPKNKGKKSGNNKNKKKLKMDEVSPTENNTKKDKETKVTVKNTKKKKKASPLPLDLSTKSGKQKLPIIPSASMGYTSSSQILSLFTQNLQKDDGKHFLF